MDTSDYIKAARLGNGKYRISNVHIRNTGADDLDGEGTIEFSKNGFISKISIKSPNVKIPMLTGSITRSFFWEIKGVIDDRLEFCFHGVPSVRTTSMSVERESLLILIFHFNRLDLFPDDLERKRHQTVVSELEQKSPPEVRFEAIILNFRILALNGGTDFTEKNAFYGERGRQCLDTFSGEVPQWRYGLVQRGDDMHVYFYSKSEYLSRGIEFDKRYFEAFLRVIAFTHGQHTWPFSFRYAHDWQVIVEHIQLGNDNLRTRYEPFLSLNSTLWPAAVQKVYLFFLVETTLVEEVTELLFLFREATSPGMPKRLGLLNLCILLESLVCAIYSEKTKVDFQIQEANFNDQKTKAIECIENIRNAENSLNLSRIIAILRTTSYMNTRSQFEAVIKGIGFDWNEKWTTFYSEWSSARNPIAHRLAGGIMTEDSIRNSSIIESKIAGALNSIVLKLMGYSGAVHPSPFEQGSWTI